MRSSEIKSFESNVKSLDALNNALKSVDSSKVQVGKLGHVKVTVECTVDNKTYEANFSRGELAKFALQLAKLDNTNNNGQIGLIEFKERLENLNKVIDDTLSKNKSKRVRVGRKVASVVRHFHNPDKKIKKAIDKMPYYVHETSGRSASQSEDSKPIKPTLKGSTSSSDRSASKSESKSPMSPNQLEESWANFKPTSATKKQKNTRRAKATPKQGSGSHSISETEMERKKRKGQHLYSVPTPGKLEINRSSKSGGSSSQEE